MELKKVNQIKLLFDSEQPWRRWVRPVTLALSAVLLLTALCLPDHRLWLCLIAWSAAIWEVIWGALAEIIDKKPTARTAVALAGIIALSTGYMLESVLMLIILAAGFWFKRHFAASLLEEAEYYEALGGLRARVRTGDRLAAVPVAQLAAGAQIEVYSGEIFPADGIVLSGEGSVDYSNFVHHHRTVPFAKDSRVYCGGVNHGQTVSVKVVAAGPQCLAQKIHALSQTALTRPAAMQKLFARFLPFVRIAWLVLAVIVGLFVPLFGALPWTTALYRGAGILMLSAFTDIAETIRLLFFVALTALCREGVLVQNCRQLMLLRRITDMIFSKTGILTQRTFIVDEVVPHNEYTKEQLLYYAACGEQISNHLIAKAIVREAGVVDLPKPEHQMEIPGEGVCAVVDGQRIFVGNDLLMTRAGIHVLPYHGQGMICFVGVEDTYIGCVILHDPLKNTSTETTNGLFALGLHSLDLITGDKKHNAENVGATLGLHRVFAQLDVAGKEQAVARNARKGRHGSYIAYVGDDVDKGCLQAADISFSMKTLEDDIGGTTADIMVLSDDPIGVLHSFILSYKLHRHMIVIPAVTAGLKVLLTILLLVGWMPLWVIALAETALRIFALCMANTCRHFKK